MTSMPRTERFHSPSLENQLLLRISEEIQLFPDAGTNVHGPFRTSRRQKRSTDSRPSKRKRSSPSRTSGSDSRRPLRKARSQCSRNSVVRRCCPSMGIRVRSCSRLPERKPRSSPGQVPAGSAAASRRQAVRSSSSFHGDRLPHPAAPVHSPDEETGYGR